MFELQIERVFSAAHAILINGEREPLHGHDWRVRVVVAAESLDANGLVCDFHLLERQLDRVIGPWHNHTLNDLPPFDRVNPTAENVAKLIADAVARVLPANARLIRVSVTEAPGCQAAYVI